MYADVCLLICLLQYMPFSIEDRIKEEGALYTKARFDAPMPLCCVVSWSVAQQHATVLHVWRCRVMTGPSMLLPMAS
jgi:hypothetical protein